jgi:hypothetical protein
MEDTIPFKFIIVDQEEVIRITRIDVEPETKLNEIARSIMRQANIVKKSIEFQYSHNKEAYRGLDGKKEV